VSSIVAPALRSKLRLRAGAGPLCGARRLIQPEFRGPPHRIQDGKVTGAY
jgi:hypothetical protein